MSCWIPCAIVSILVSLSRSETRMVSSLICPTTSGNATLDPSSRSNNMARSASSVIFFSSNASLPALRSVWRFLCDGGVEAKVMVSSKSFACMVAIFLRRASSLASSLCISSSRSCLKIFSNSSIASRSSSSAWRCCSVASSRFASSRAFSAFCIFSIACSSCC